MSSSEGVKVADAIATGLNAATFSRPFDAAVGYGLRLKLEDADTLRVDVAPVGTTAERDDRASIKWLSRIDIGVRYRFGMADQDATTGEVENDSVDTYRYLLQEIVQWCYENPRPSSYSHAVLAEDVDVRADVIQKHLDEWNQFTGIIRVVYATRTEFGV